MCEIVGSKKGKMPEAHFEIPDPGKRPKKGRKNKAGFFIHRCTLHLHIKHTVRIEKNCFYAQVL